MYVMVVVQKIKPDFEEFHFFLWRFFISLFGNHDMSNHTLNTSYVIRKNYNKNAGWGSRL
jgi:hypothetical protein